MQEILGRKGLLEKLPCFVPGEQLTLEHRRAQVKNVHPKAVLSTRHDGMCREGLYQVTPS